MRGMDRRTFLVGGVGWLVAAGRARGGGGGGPSGHALVTADAEAHVAVVRFSGRARMRVVRRVRTVEDPRSIERSPGGTVAVVGHAGEGAVSLLSLGRGGDVGVRRVLRGFAAPRYTAFARGGSGLAYVSDSDAGEIAVVDLRAGRVLRRVGVGDGARHLGLSPDGRRLWVALGSSAAAIAVVDTSDPTRPRRVATARTSFLVHDVAFSPSGRRVWVTAGREPHVAILSAFTGSTLKTLAADAAPQHLTFSPRRAYVASGDSGALRVHALTDGRPLRHTRIPIGSYNIQRTPATAILTPSLATGTLTLLAADGTTLASEPITTHAHDTCLSR
jgi:DNA-binding beta-propeller fold protein YncE